MTEPVAKDPLNAKAGEGAANASTSAIAPPSAPSSASSVAANTGADKPRRVQIGVSYPARPAFPPPTQPQGRSSGGQSGRAEDGPRPRTVSEVDDDLDREMERALGVAGAVAPRDKEKPLKRQWDDELEDELQAAFAEFDPADFETASRGRKAFEQPAPQDQRFEMEKTQDRTRIAEGRGPRLAKLISARGDHVFVDIGGKSEGIIPLEQFRQLGKDVPAPGSLLEVIVQRHDPDEGITHVALKGAAVEATWDNLRKGAVIEVRVTKANKGGVDVEVGGIRGFMPISQIDLNRVEADDLSPYINQRLRVMVTDANERARNLVVSRKELMIQEREEQKVKTWAELEEGQTRRGTVRSVKDFGAFVDLGGVDGLLHVGDMSWTRLKDVYGFMKAGQEVEVKILKIDRETQKINLGLKQLAKSPWDDVDDNYPVGQIVSGKVVRLQEFGAFVELEPGVDGLVHISEISKQKFRKASDVLKEDQEVDVQILKVDREGKKISLSIRQAEETKAKAADAAALAEIAANAPKPEPGAESNANANADSLAEGATPPDKEEEATKSKPKFQGPLKGGIGGDTGAGGLFGSVRE